MVRGLLLIFSSNRSFLFRKRIMEVSVNHLLLQMLSNSFILSCIRFWGRKKGKWRRSSRSARWSVKASRAEPILPFYSSDHRDCNAQRQSSCCAWTQSRTCCYVIFHESHSWTTHHLLVLSQHQVIIAESHAEDDGRHTLKAMDPLFPLRPLTAYIKHPGWETGVVVWAYCSAWLHTLQAVLVKSKGSTAVVSKENR